MSFHRRRHRLYHQPTRSHLHGSLRVPEDYYDEILDHVDTPIVFAEVRWQAGGDMSEWSGTPEKEAATACGDERVVWSFLWDQEAVPSVFSTRGLNTPGAGQGPPSQ